MFLLSASLLLPLRYFAFGAGPLSFSASSTVTLSPFFTFWSAAGGKWSSIRPSGVLMKSRPLSGATLVTSPVIVWRPITEASVAACVGCGGDTEGLCAKARPASSKPAVVPASMAGSFMAFFLLFPRRPATRRSNAHASPRQWSETIESAAHVTPDLVHSCFFTLRYFRSRAFLPCKSFTAIRAACLDAERVPRHGPSFLALPRGFPLPRDRHVTCETNSQASAERTQEFEQAREK